MSFYEPNNHSSVLIGVSFCFSILWYVCPRTLSLSISIKWLRMQEIRLLKSLLMGLMTCQRSRSPHFFVVFFLQALVLFLTALLMRISSHSNVDGHDLSNLNQRYPFRKVWYSFLDLEHYQWMFSCILGRGDRSSIPYNHVLHGLIHECIFIGSFISLLYIDLIMILP